MAWQPWEGQRRGCWALGEEGRRGIEGKEGGRKGGREGSKGGNVKSDIQKQRERITRRTAGAILAART